MKRFVLLVVLLSVALGAFASGQQVVVLYNGRTRANSDSLQYLQRYFRDAGISMNVTANASVRR